VRKISFFIILFNCCVFNGLAQEISVSPVIESIRRNEAIEILGAYKENIYSHLYDNNDHLLMAHNTNLRMIWRKELPLDRRNFRFEKLLYDRGRFQLIFSKRSRQSQIIYGLLMNSEGVPDTTNAIVLDTMQKKIGENFFDISIAESDDKKHVVAYWIDPNTFEKNELYYVIFDRQFQSIKKGHLELPFVQKRAAFHSLLISNSGQIYVTIAEYKSQQMENAIRFWILTSGNNFRDYDHIEIKTESNLYLNNVRFKIDNLNEYINVIGFYTEGSTSNRAAEGIYFARIPFHSSQAEVSHYEAFTPEFIARIKGNRKSGKNSKLYSFIIDKVILRKDGGLLFVAESFYKTYRTTNYLYDIYGFPSYNESTVIYHFDELIVLSLHPNGKIHWKNIIVKNQSSNGDYGRYSSYQMMNSGAFLKIFFNEKISSRTNLIEYTIDVNGKMSRQVLLNSRSYNVYLMPQYGRQISVDEIVFPSMKKSELRLLKLNYHLD